MSLIFVNSSEKLETIPLPRGINLPMGMYYSHPFPFFESEKAREEFLLSNAKLLIPVFQIRVLLYSKNEEIQSKIEKDECISFFDFDIDSIKDENSVVISPSIENKRKMDGRSIEDFNRFVGEISTSHFFLEVFSDNADVNFLRCNHFLNTEDLKDFEIHQGKLPTKKESVIPSELDSESPSPPRRKNSFSDSDEYSSPQISPRQTSSSVSPPRRSPSPFRRSPSPLRSPRRKSSSSRRRSPSPPRRSPKSIKKSTPKNEKWRSKKICFDDLFSPEDREFALIYFLENTKEFEYFSNFSGLNKEELRFLYRKINLIPKSEYEIPELLINFSLLEDVEILLEIILKCRTEKYIFCKTFANFISEEMALSLFDRLTAIKWNRGDYLLVHLTTQLLNTFPSIVKGIVSDFSSDNEKLRKVWKKLINFDILNKLEPRIGRKRLLPVFRDKEILEIFLANLFPE